MKTTHTFGGIKINTSISFGLQGDQGPTEIHAIVAHAGAFVMQITGYYGAGTPPPFTGFYLGPTGPVENIEDATHFGGGSAIPEVQGAYLTVNANGDYLTVNANGDYLVII